MLEPDRFPRAFGSRRSAFRSRETYAWSVLCAESGGPSGHSSSMSCPTGHDLPGMQGEDREERALPSDPRARSAGPRRRRRTGRGTGSPREPPAGTTGLPARDSQAQVSDLQAACAITDAMNAARRALVLLTVVGGRWNRQPSARGEPRRAPTATSSSGATSTTATHGGRSSRRRRAARGVRQLTHPPKGVLDNVPDWSPDGRHIAFQRVDPNGCGRGLRDGRHLGGHERREEPHARRIRP